MKAVKGFIGVAVVCGALALSSCGGGSEDICGDTKVRYEHLVNNYTSRLVRYEKPLDMSSYGEIPKPLANNETLAWNTFSIEIKATYQSYTVQAAPAFRFSLFEEAVACSPAPPRAKQILTKISITSANDYSPNYPAGSELVSLFGFVENASTNVSAAFVNWPAPLEFKLKLLEAPKSASQNFEVKISLDDGNTYILKTGDVYFNLP